jgi:hypothetical protein
MAILFDGEIHVHYGFICVVPPRSGTTDLAQTRGGQVNGICGAAVPGTMALTTGLHTGLVPLVVEALDAPPTAHGDWDDIVEVSFVAHDVDLALAAFDDTAEFQLPAPGTYRVRYCARGMDAANDATRMRDEPVIDRYRLTFWPASAEPDALIQQTSNAAAYWHGVARRTPPPPPPPTSAEVVAAEAAKAIDEAARGRRWREMLEARRWGGQGPSDRLRAIGGNTAHLVRLDPELAEALAAIDSVSQRSMAVWAPQGRGPQRGVGRMPTRTGAGGHRSRHRGRSSAPGAGGVPGRGPATARGAAALEPIRRTKPDR